MGKMLGNVEGSLQTCYAESLDRIRARESLSIQLPHHTVSFGDCLAQASEEFGARDGAKFGELLVAPAEIGCAAQT